MTLSRETNIVNNFALKFLNFLFLDFETN